jgi:1,4-dihydroxy-2-naphthoyl-CoA synthase
MTFSEYERLRFERRDQGVLLITMDRPDKYNAADEHEMLTFMGPDVLEGAAALTEKRTPRFPSAQPYQWEARTGSRGRDQGISPG